ncbi:MAG: hypothetical protein JW809_02055 [Pirellulales bacterium]|nr:hypothetical protein [Pirellulales bacterium]
MSGAGQWVFPIFVLFAAAGMAVWHVRVWRGVRRQELPPEETRFYWGQCRRRVQCSAMLALLAVGMLAGPHIPVPRMRLVLGLAMLLLVVWLGLLALGDLVVSRHHYERLASRCAVEQAKLEREVRRLSGLGGNGQAGAEPTGDKDQSPH